MPGRRGRRGFGYVRKLPSRRWQASYVGPDTLRHTAPSTFESREDAEAWLTDRRRQIQGDEWEPPAAVRKRLSFAEYADSWLADRTLKPRTRAHYRSLLDARILPTFGPFPLKAITADAVRRWHADTGTKTPTLRAHSYGLLRSILGSAVQDQLIPVNPCHIRGAGTSKRVHRPKPATLDELEAITTAMPPKYRLMVLLGGWCAMRFGELAELRRSDIDVKSGVIHIRRAVARANGQAIVSTPKSDAGVRDVAIPPHLMPAVKEHLSTNITGGKDGLLFPAADGTSHLAPSTLAKSFEKARAAAGRPDLRFHDLRHTGATMAAGAGASLAELMSRLGHSTPAAALRYQHAAAGRDHQIAVALSALVGGNTP
jgi:integrase